MMAIEKVRVVKVPQDSGGDSSTLPAYLKPERDVDMDGVVKVECDTAYFYYYRDLSPAPSPLRRLCRWLRLCR